MQALKNFFILIWRCSSSLGVYGELVTRGVGRGIGYLYILLVLSSSLWILPLLGKTPALSEEVVPVSKSLAEEIQKFYPPELEIAVERGELRANVTQPYFIPMPAKLKEVLDKEPSDSEWRARNAKHFIEIDTNARVEDYLQRESLVLITKRSIVVPDKEKGLEVKTIPRNESFVLNRAIYDSYVPKVLYYIEMLPWFVSVAAPVCLIGLWFIIPCFTIVAYLFYLLFTSLLLRLLVVVLGARLSYGQIYAVSFYGLTPVILFQSIWESYGSFPSFLFSILFLGWMGFVCAALARDKQSQKA